MDMIAGQINWAGNADHAAVQRMVEDTQIRSGDDGGLWSSACGHCAFAYRSVSIFDAGASSRQPMVDPHTGNVLLFIGEIYNYCELRKACEAAGDVFRSKSDTEVILSLYRQHGIGCLAYLRGLFAIALWDTRGHKLILARDRLGKKPLNYAHTTNGIIFGSDIRMLANHPAISREMDLQALELYLQFSVVPAPWTIYQQIRKLPPGHYAAIEHDGVRLHRYWDIDYRTKHRLSDDEALEAFEEKLTDAVRLRMTSDVPLGASLSGGVDSSVVVALMAKLADVPINTFSIGFREEAFNELPYAQQASSICRTAHRAEILAGDVHELLPFIARHYGEPYADPSAVPSFHFCRFARRHVKAIFNGDGGDELLGGYARYSVPGHVIRINDIVSRGIGPRRQADWMLFWANVESVPMRALRRLCRGLMSPELSWLLMFAGHRSDQLLPRSSDASLLDKWRLQWLLRAYEHADNPIDRLLWLESHTYLPDDLLVKMDIAARHCGLELRSPLLDHKVIEFCAGLPVTMKVRGGTGKFLLKKLAEKYFPRDFVYRRKMGFSIPVAQWLRGELRRHVEDLILEPSVMEPLHMPAVRASWHRLIADDGPTSDAEAGRVWTLLMYGQWRAQEKR